jgi:hypothetical protein
MIYAGTHPGMAGALAISFPQISAFMYCTHRAFVLLFQTHRLGIPIECFGVTPVHLHAIVVQLAPYILTFRRKVHT